MDLKTVQISLKAIINPGNQMWDRNEQTICAISTPHGVGGIAVIRVSGNDALKYVLKITPKLKTKKIETHRAYFAVLYDEQNRKLDEVVLTFFEKGRSFTGEETVEISCHGSTYISQKILDLLIQNGCRMANPGEFTFRAFLNDRIDLIQAESVLSLIESNSRASARVAQRQLDGEVSKSIELLISELTWCLAHIEASIDFSEQGIEVVDQLVLINKLKKIAIGLKDLSRSYQSGVLLKDGVRVVLVGEPNVGKSSLLNVLLRQERAIVTPIAGTTRDAIEGETIYDGVKFSICDTAGLRETQDQVEIIGINKSLQEADRADVLCFVVDSSQNNWERAIQLARQKEHVKKLFILNKSDLVGNTFNSELQQKVDATGASHVFTNVSDLSCREAVFSSIRGLIGDLNYMNDVAISSSRQKEHIDHSLASLSESIADLEKNTGSEFVAMNLKEALISLQKILGQVYDDQILDRVFKEFCLGK